MLPSTAKSRPRFWPQAVWILAPMILLAVLAFQTLMQDRDRAFEDAQRNARAATDRLARLIEAEWRDGAERYLEVCRVWAAFELGRLGVVVDAMQTQVPGSLWQQTIDDWLGRQPDCPPEAQPFPDVFVQNGRLIYPPDDQQISEPPAWFRDMEEALYSEWHLAQLLVETIPEDSRAAWRRLMDRLVDPAARAVVELELHCLEQGRLSVDEWEAGWFELRRKYPGWITETGTTFEARLAEKALLVFGSRPVGIDVLQDLSRHAFRSPGLLTEHLVQVSARRTVDSSEKVKRAQQSLQRIWNSQSRAREIHRQAQRTFDGNMSNSVLRLSHGLDRFLYCKVGELQDPAQKFEGPAVPPILHWRIFPESLIRSAIDRARIRHGAAVPPYERFQFRFAGEAVRPNPTTLKSPDFEAVDESKGVVLSQSTVPIGVPRSGSEEQMEVRMILVSPTLLYQQARDRSLFFGALIAAAAVVSLFGLFSARRAFLEQHRLAELKGGFVSSVTHELRAPIASVRLLAESLQRGAVRDPRRQAEYFGWIVQECRRLTALIENVLDFARIDQGRKSYEMEPTDVAALIQDSIRSMSPGAMERNVRLMIREGTSEFLASVSPPSWDGRAVQQALVNLIDNAIKHSPAGSSIFVAAEPANQGSFMRLSVQDAGPGIPTEDHERIFEIFFRRGSELRRETEGIGIGLAIVRHVANGHRGLARVESTPGRGSRFSLELPLQPLNEQPT